MPQEVLQVLLLIPLTFIQTEAGEEKKDGCEEDTEGVPRSNRALVHAATVRDPLNHMMQDDHERSKSLQGLGLFQIPGLAPAGSLTSHARSPHEDRRDRYRK